MELDLDDKWTRDDHIRDIGRRISSRDAKERLNAWDALGRLAVHDKAFALESAGRLAYDKSDFTTARLRYEEYLSICQANGITEGYLEALQWLARCAFSLKNYAEENQYYVAALTLAQQLGDKEATARFMLYIAQSATHAGDTERGYSLLNQALDLSRNEGLTEHTSLALYLLGQTIREKDYTAARAYLEESLALRREMGDREKIADTLAGLGYVVGRLGDHERAHALLEECLEISRELSSPEEVADTIYGTGYAAARAGDKIRAKTLFEEVLAKTDGNLPGHYTAYALHYLGNIAEGAKEHASSARYMRQAIKIYNAQSDLDGLTGTLHNLARTYVHLEQPVCSAKLFGYLDNAARNEKKSGSSDDPNLKFRNYYVPILRRKLGRMKFMRLWLEGEKMMMEEAVSYALQEQP
jgi:tetratricopeptide (TPR) repeat protein